MSQDDFPGFLGVAAETYAEGAEQSGEMTYAQAKVRAGRDLHALLPDGPDTPAMLLRTLVVGAETVGHIWLGVRGPEGGRYGWVWDVHVDRDHRGHGYAAAAMRLIEDEAASALGVSEVRLNVFATNEPAVRLYDRLGFAVTSQVMRKPVD